MSAFWTLLHLAGYLALVGQAAYLTTGVLVGRRDRKRLVDASRRTERIAKLELALGVGLSYGRDWITSKPIPVTEDYSRALAAEGNGAVERKCLGCDTVYRPHDVYKSETPPAWYRQTPDVRELTDRLCRDCYVNATRELDLLPVTGAEL